MRYFLDLFSGIGGFALRVYWAGLRFDAHYFSEVDPYAIRVYSSRFPDAIPLGDIRKIRGTDLPSGDWIIADGFPCQDISVAGKGAGLAGERSGLWYEYARLIGELRPRFAIMENVGALAFRGLDAVLGGLSTLGYDAEWQDIRASDVGAPHRRERLWIVAYPQRDGIWDESGRGDGESWACASEPSNDGEKGAMANSYPFSRDGSGQTRDGRAESPNSREAIPDPESKRWREGRSRGSPCDSGGKPNKHTGLWPTPTVNDAKNSLTESQRGRGTLTANFVERLWPTPRTAGICGWTGNWNQLKDKCESLDEARKMGAGNGGQLNPQWVEWLMGYPLGWTDLNISAIRLCLK